VLAQYYQPDIIYLISGGVNRSLDIYQCVPIMVNDTTKAYSVQVRISDDMAEVVHKDTDALLSQVVYGFRQRVGYGHPGGYKVKTATGKY